MSGEGHPPATRPAGEPVESGARPARSEARPAPARAIDSDRLFDGATELLIDHHGVLYRLKRTALGKLILTK